MLKPLLVCMCARVLLRGCACAHTMPITLSQLSPQEHSPVFTILQSHYLISGPFGAFDPELGEAGKQRTGPAEEEFAPCCAPGIFRSRLCLSELSLAGPQSHQCPPHLLQAHLSLPTSLPSTTGVLLKCHSSVHRSAGLLLD